MLTDFIWFSFSLSFILVSSQQVLVFLFKPDLIHCVILLYIFQLWWRIWYSEIFVLFIHTLACKSSSSLRFCFFVSISSFCNTIVRHWNNLVIEIPEFHLCSSPNLFLSLSSVHILHLLGSRLSPCSTWTQTNNHHYINTTQPQRLLYSKEELDHWPGLPVN